MDLHSWINTGGVPRSQAAALWLMWQKKAHLLAREPGPCEWGWWSQTASSLKSGGVTDEWEIQTLRVICKYSPALSALNQMLGPTPKEQRGESPGRVQWTLLSPGVWSADASVFKRFNSIMVEFVWICRSMHKGWSLLSGPTHHPVLPGDRWCVPLLATLAPWRPEHLNPRVGVGHAPGSWEIRLRVFLCRETWH